MYVIGYIIFMLCGLPALSSDYVRRFNTLKENAIILFTVYALLTFINVVTVMKITFP